VIYVEIRHIPDFQRYELELSHIRQRTPDWCIPANIESVTKYFLPDSSVTQQYLWDKWVEACLQSGENSNSISFGSIKRRVLDNDQNYLRFDSEVITDDIRRLALSVIPSRIDVGPLIISLPAFIPMRWHVYTVVGCSRLGALHLHDTGTGRLLWRDLSEMEEALRQRSQTTTDTLIIRPK